LAVLALMYHGVPCGDAASPYDVPLPQFREHVTALAGCDLPFIAFDDIEREHLEARDTYVSVTFDDGLADNAAAIELLAKAGIRPIEFVVSDWARAARGHLSAREIAGLSEVCAFGGHGASHTDLTSLAPDALRAELADSRAFLEDVLGREVTSMAAPGGCLNDRVVRSARAVGFRRIGNSVPLSNMTLGPTINRIAIRGSHTAEDISSMLARGRSHWRMQATFHMARTAVTKTIGGRGYGLLSAAAKRALRPAHGSR
jgi:peptidoglycan/xylan/chitin deacetylase (PgdA/CDA1 family)